MTNDSLRKAQQSQKMRQRVEKQQNSYLKKKILFVSLFWQFSSSLQEAKRYICLASSAWRPLGFLTLRGPRGEQLQLLPLVKTDTYLLACTCGGTHCLSLPLKHLHKYTPREQREKNEIPCNGWCRCEDVAIWEFPKAMKYAGCNGRANSSLRLTTCVQRKGLLLDKQHTCPVNMVSHCYSPFSLL